MIKDFVSMLICFSLLGCQATPVRVDSNAVSELQEAERLGRMLFEAVRSEDGNSPYTNREKDLVEMSKDLACDGEYTAVSVNDDINKIENIYLVLTSTKDQGVQFGRHIKFRFKLGTNDIMDVSPSTKTCLLVPSAPNSIPFSTHLLSATPTEFHVFLSLYHQTELYVGTSEGVWSVENGVIREVKK